MTYPFSSLNDHSNCYKIYSLNGLISLYELSNLYYQSNIYDLDNPIVRYPIMPE